jgi:MFS family permease
VLVGLMLLVTVVATEAMAVATVMPTVEEDLGSLWLYGWVFSAFQLGTLVGIVVAGREADRVNPAVPMGIGLAVFCAGLVVAGFAPAMWVVVAGRVLQGFGAGAIPTTAYVCVGRGFEPSLRPKVFAVLSTAWILPSLVAPAAASAVASSFGWRWVFLGLIPVAVLAGGLAVRSVRTLGSPQEPAEPDGGRLALVIRLTLGGAALLAGLTADTVVVGMPLVLAGGWMVLSAFKALTPVGTLTLRTGLPAAVGLRGVLTFAFFSADAFVPLALTSVRGRSTLYAGMVLAMCAVTWTVGSWMQARFADAWGAARLVRVGALVSLASMALYCIGLSESVPVWIWFAGSALAGLGIGLAYSPLSVVTLADAEPGREGAATTALQLSDVFGIAIGTGLAGALVAIGERLTDTNAPAIAAVFAVAFGFFVVLGAGAARLVVAPPRGDQATAMPSRAWTRRSRCL